MRSGAGRTTIVQRAPWLVAGPFGLLRSLGFAGAPAEVGLPRGGIPLALFAFRVGIELGQLAFVAIVLVAMAGLRKPPVPWPRWAPALPAYAIGSLAIYWFLERLTREVIFRICGWMPTSLRGDGLAVEDLVITDFVKLTGLLRLPGADRAPPPTRRAAPGPRRRTRGLLDW